MMTAAANFHMWVTFAVILGALILYAIDLVPAEITSVGVLCVITLIFHFYPLAAPNIANVITAERVLMGFANPALITVLALLVVGQGMVRAGVLDRGAQYVLALGGGVQWLSILVALAVVLVVSGFLNNIPVVVLFIPIMEVIANRFSVSVSKVMMPLSFAAVLGGMTTLIGSGTNLLVSGALVELGEKPFSFFQFTVPGLVLAAVGLVFVFLMAPRLLKDRTSLIAQVAEGEGRQFIAQITVTPECEAAGLTSNGGVFGVYPDLTLRMIQRDELAVLPPFENFTIEPGDVMVAAATR